MGLIVALIVASATLVTSSCPAVGDTKLNCSNLRIVLDSIRVIEVLGSISITMKILDPQSAVLTNSEVLSFMRSHPPRKPDPQVGGYPVTDMRGLWSVQREFIDYIETITPHLLSYPDPPSKFMRALLQRLNKFNLTKPEVLVMINLGVGVKKAPGATQEAIQIPNGEEEEMAGNGDGDLLDKVERHLDSAEGADGAQAENRAAGHEDVQMQDEQEEDNSDITVLNTIVEEMYDRFTDADIKEILQICGEILGGSETPREETYVANG